MRFPDLAPARALYCFDRRIATCAGGVAGAEMMLHLVETHCGPAVAQEAMHACLLTAPRSGEIDQLSPILSRVATRNAALLRAVEWLERHFLAEDCLQGAAPAANVSLRQLQRLFQANLGKSPLQYVIDLRLTHARLLLSRTNLSVLEVALACGYDQASTFSKAFRARFGTAPSRFAAFDRVVA